MRREYPVVKSNFEWTTRELESKTSSLEAKTSELALKATELESKTKEITAFEDRIRKLELQNFDLRAKNQILKSENEDLIATIDDLALKNHQLEAFKIKANSDSLIIRNFLGNFSSETVSMTISPQQKRFHVHVDAICAASVYFKKILFSGESRLECKSITLNDEVCHEEAFGMFLEYCYFGCYFENQDSESHPLVLHSRVYALAEKLECAPLKELALKKATSWCHGNHQTDKLNGVFPHILDAIHIIYSYTDDQNSGLLPITTANDSDAATATRDGFHMLLFLDDGSKLSAKNKDQPNIVDDVKITPEVVEESEIAAHSSRTMRNFRSITSAEIFTVIVGLNERFNLHSTALGCSGYFRKLTASNMKEGRDRTVHLSSSVDDPNAFAMFSQYCYFQDYRPEQGSGPMLLLHAKVYTLAEKLECLPLKDLSYQKANFIMLRCLQNQNTPPLLQGSNNTAHLGPHSAKAINQILSNLSKAISVIYEYTYDSRYEKMFREDHENNDTNTKEPNAPSSDSSCDEKFRFSLATLASAYLSKLRKDKSFVAVYHQFPDFATDVVMLAKGRASLELDEHGRLKLPRE
ncbi:hypothetical protein TWF694_005033 [Orbilia ellipsospora]|uniref:BTB domain-containing protein n=1 Tax=Orbilia ellipsospora TaxID=2528407 RepID=A0AAV9X0H7_9PEZI